MSRTADIDTSGFRRCIGTLETAFEQFRREEQDETLRRVFNAACDRQFELVLNIGGSLLRRRLGDLFTSSREADRLTFRDAFTTARNTASCRRRPVNGGCNIATPATPPRTTVASISPRRRWSLLPRLSRMRGPLPMPLRTRAMADGLLLQERHRTALERALEASTIPFLVQARDWARLPERFHREIERRHAVLREAQTIEGAASNAPGGNP